VDNITKKASERILESLKKALQKDNLYEAALLGTRLTEISSTLDSKIGVFVGETIESSLLQLHEEMIRYEIDDDKRAKEMHGLTLLVEALADSIGSGIDENIYSALLELRCYASKKQHSIAGEYRRRRPGRFR